jgi:hypothetical protein
MLCNGQDFGLGQLAWREAIFEAQHRITTIRGSPPHGQVHHIDPGLVLIQGKHRSIRGNTPGTFPLSGPHIATRGVKLRGPRE